MARVGRERASSEAGIDERSVAGRKMVALEHELERFIVDRAISRKIPNLDGGDQGNF